MVVGTPGLVGRLITYVCAIKITYRVVSGLRFLEQYVGNFAICGGLVVNGVSFGLVMLGLYCFNVFIATSTRGDLGAYRCLFNVGQLYRVVIYTGLWPWGLVGNFALYNGRGGQCIEFFPSLSTGLPAIGLQRRCVGRGRVQDVTFVWVRDLLAIGDNRNFGTFLFGVGSWGLACVLIVVGSWGLFFRGALSPFMTFMLPVLPRSIMGCVGWV